VLDEIEESAVLLQIIVCIIPTLSKVQNLFGKFVYKVKPSKLQHKLQ